MKTVFHKIVVTGYSTVNAAGNGLEPLLELLGSGNSSLTVIPDDIPVGNGALWGKANGFKASDFIPPLKARKMDRASQFAVAATGLALKDAALVPREMNPERIGIALGCGFGGVANSAEFLTGYFNSGIEGLTPLLFPNTVSNAAASNASIEHGMKGPNVTQVQRFCSAESAFLMACRFIEEGRADVMLTGGVDDLIPLMIRGFSALGQSKKYAHVFGEGCGIMVLESAEHAAGRGAAVKGIVNSVSTIGELLKGSEQEGMDHLLGDSVDCSVASLSGTADLFAPFATCTAEMTTLNIAPLTGRSLAMGGTAMAALLASLQPGQSGLHLAASPEGPYYAIRFTGGSPDLS